MTKTELENKDKEIARLWEHKKVDTQTIQEQSDLIELLKKALELVCEIAVGNEEMNCSGISCSDSCKYKGVCKDIKRVADYFKTKAKEMMKSE